MKDVLRKIREINRYIKDNFLKLSVVLFGIFILSAVVSYFVMLSLPREEIELAIESLKEMFDIDNMMEKRGLELFWAIFVNNLKACGISFVSAIIPFLFYPLWSVISNGISSGMVYGMCSYVGAENMFMETLKFVVPHAIFEIPIFLLSSAIGLRWCVWLSKKMFGKGKDISLKYHFERLSEIMVVYIIPFLLIAGFLEGVVEPWVFGM